MRRNPAFTLIELLVVIAIIAIVAAILFPVFASAKRASKKTVALSNLDQIGKAVHMYLADYDDTLPFHFGEVPEWPGYNVLTFIFGGQGYLKIYDPYIRDSAVWMSPEDRLTNPGYTSFAANEQLCYSWPMSEIARPAEAIYLTDRTDINVPNAAVVDSYVWWQFTDQAPFTEASLPGTLDPVSVAAQIDPIRYVGNVAAYLFLDSHVATMPFGRTWGDSSHNLHLATKS